MFHLPGEVILSEHCCESFLPVQVTVAHIYEWCLYGEFYMLIRESSTDSDDAHPVVATARGVYDSTGGILESKETGQLCIGKCTRSVTWC